MEGAEQILAFGEVDPGFAADGGVHLRQKGGGNLHDVNAAHVNGCEEAGDVADNAATEGDNGGLAVGAAAHQLGGEVADGFERLGALAVGHFDDGVREFSLGERGGERFGPVFPDRRNRDDEVARAVGQSGAEKLAGARSADPIRWSPCTDGRGVELRLAAPSHDSAEARNRSRRLAPAVVPKWERPVASLGGNTDYRRGEDVTSCGHEIRTQ